MPLYLHHRYAVESAASAIGGQNYIYAMRGDGRVPLQWVPAAAQRAALNALVSTIKPSELALSQSVIGEASAAPCRLRPHASCSRVTPAAPSIPSCPRPSQPT